METSRNMEVISTYTRQDALRDGVLIGVGTLAEQAGFRFPVALTSAAWAACVAVPVDAEGQDETGRLWDLLSMLRWAARNNPSVKEVHFQVLVKNDEQPARPVELKAVVDTGDNCEPVLTVMLPEED